MKQIFRIAVAAVLISLGVSVRLCAAAHFQLPYPVTSSSSLCDFLGTFQIAGREAQPGDEVAFFDPQGVLCGVGTVPEEGKYGMAHVYGDDRTTSGTDEGASTGDILTVRIWDAENRVERRGDDILLFAGVGMSEYFGPSLIPPQWQPDKGFVLNIQVQAPKMDLDGSGKVDLPDAVLILQLMAGENPAMEDVFRADISGDGKIGLQELVNILQTIAGLKTP